MKSREKIRSLNGDMYNELFDVICKRVFSVYWKMIFKWKVHIQSIGFNLGKISESVTINTLT